VTAPDWLWIPITLWAAFAQTLRNAAQRHLTADLGTLGATLVHQIPGPVLRKVFGIFMLFVSLKLIIGK